MSRPVRQLRVRLKVLYESTTNYATDSAILRVLLRVRLKVIYESTTESNTESATNNTTENTSTMLVYYRIILPSSLSNQLGSSIVFFL